MPWDARGRSEGRFPVVVLCLNRDAGPWLAALCDDSCERVAGCSGRDRPDELLPMRVGDRQSSLAYVGQDLAFQAT